MKKHLPVVPRYIPSVFTFYKERAFFVRQTTYVQICGVCRMKAKAFFLTYVFFQFDYIGSILASMFKPFSTTTDIHALYCNLPLGFC